MDLQAIVSGRLGSVVSVAAFPVHLPSRRRNSFTKSIMHTDSWVKFLDRGIYREQELVSLLMAPTDDSAVSINSTAANERLPTLRLASRIVKQNLKSLQVSGAFQPQKSITASNLKVLLLQPVPAPGQRTQATALLSPTAVYGTAYHTRRDTPCLRLRPALNRV
jgi:hypothetical protein